MSFASDTCSDIAGENITDTSLLCMENIFFLLIFPTFSKHRRANKSFLNKVLEVSARYSYYYDPTPASVFFFVFLFFSLSNRENVVIPL